MLSYDVLIVGAGPTGLVLALWLTRFGVNVKIIDKAPAPSLTSRALALHSRTLELYRQLDLAKDVLAAAHPTEAVNLWVEGEHRARIELGAIGEGLTPFPAVYMYSQDRHERLLLDRLRAQGIAVEREIELVSCEDLGSHVMGKCRGSDGTESSIQASYLVGCDGASSMVRKCIGAEFGGGTYPQRFYVADIQGSGAALNGELHVDLDHADFLAIFGMDGGGRARLVGLVREQDVADDARSEDLQFKDVTKRALASMDIAIDKVHWFSTYRVHHRVADRFRKGRIFIAGDAGHIHSPVGGQGMNTGIGDAINLAWKLATILKGQAGDSLLDSYAAERMRFAQQLVQTTDRVFTGVTSDSVMASIMRRRLAPVLLPLALRSESAREFLFRTVSQTMLTYREGPLAQGIAGTVHGGDRLPWTGAKSTDNHEPLSRACWQVHVYGEAHDGLEAWCMKHELPLHRYPWDEGAQEAGLASNAAYLLRPDGYVAVAEQAGSPAAFAEFFDHHGLRLSGAAARRQQDMVGPKR